MMEQGDLKKYESYFDPGSFKKFAEKSGCGSTADKAFHLRKLWTGRMFGRVLRRAWNSELLVVELSILLQMYIRSHLF